ncbi:MAG: two-component sensor histidine kinase [Betaproteobacteria bacterium]|nr:two-component sensor histidine kinase [Betaproteobacteria bacterium]
MTSIRRRLLVWLLASLIVATLVAAFAVYTRARSEAATLFDYQLQLMAASFPHEGMAQATAPPGTDITGTGDVVVVQIWDRNGAQLYWSRPGSPILRRLDLGFSTVATPHGEWRVFNTLIDGKVVQVSQPMRARAGLAAGLALRTMLPLLVLLPLLLGLTWITVSRGLTPLHKIAAALERRSEDALEPLPVERIPDEVTPLVTALNDLLGRLHIALDLQKSFIADAAHELRTPLTAVRLQIQVAEIARTDDERLAAFAQLKAGAERAGRLVQQLLTLARNEPGAAERPMAPVDITDVSRSAVAEHAPIAEAKGVELGLLAGPPVMANGDAAALRTLLTNLIDNAVHYTPGGGAVDVAVTVLHRHPCWIVTDTGPGIPHDERKRVFDRFYRRVAGGAEGSGLGLAIVQRIAQRHRASVELSDGDNGGGLKVTVRFPAI